MHKKLNDFLFEYIYKISVVGKAEDWFKHILFMTEHDKGLGRAKKLCLALSKIGTSFHLAEDWSYNV